MKSIPNDNPSQSSRDGISVNAIYSFAVCCDAVGPAGFWCLRKVRRISTRCRRATRNARTTMLQP